jgi:hypothetical protein
MNEVLRKQYEFALQLVLRLERLSADSYWAHKASGVRGSLLRCLDEINVNNQYTPQDSQFTNLGILVDEAFQILKSAAGDITVPEESGMPNPQPLHKETT